jgi:hypothetical protein
LTVRVHLLHFRKRVDKVRECERLFMRLGRAVSIAYKADLCGFAEPTYKRWKKEAGLTKKHKPIV